MTGPADHAATISFRLSQLGARLAQEFAERLRPIGLSPREFAVLRSIDFAGPRTQQQLADSLTMHRNNMATLADQMHRDGLVDRTPHPQDGRALQVHLTPLGRRKLAAAAAIPPALDEELTRGLSPDQIDGVHVALQAMMTALDLIPGVHPQLAANYPGTRTRSASPGGVKRTDTSE